VGFDRMKDLALILNRKRKRRGRLISIFPSR